MLINHRFSFDLSGGKIQAAAIDAVNTAQKGKRIMKKTLALLLALLTVLGLLAGCAKDPAKDPWLTRIGTMV